MTRAEPQIAIRRATVADVPAMIDIVNEFAERSLMIHRSRAEMYDRLLDFQVADREGRVVGAAGLRVMWANLAEIYALAVSHLAQGAGVGRALVDANVAQARSLGIRRVFALTYERTFFERCGFEVVDRRTLPLKVWGECSRCPKHEACDEIAMVRVLEDVPDRGGPLPTTEHAAAYDVAIPRVTPAVLRVDRGEQ
mgnify:CR=1 FL=1